MTVYEIISLIISLLSLIATIAVSVTIALLGKKAKKKHEKENNQTQARTFIINHEKEIKYLPLCVIASSVNRQHSHNRKIYNDFSILPDDVQKEVLNLKQYNLPLIKGIAWIDEGIEEIRKFISENKLTSDGNDMLYENAKYFRRAMSIPEFKYDKYYKFHGKYPDIFGEKHNSVVPTQSGKLSFSSYFWLYMEEMVQKGNPNHLKAIPPLSLMFETEDIYGTSDEMVYYWIMEMMEEIALYIIHQNKYETIISFDETITETYEDRYYEVLCSLYNITHGKPGKD